MTVRRRRLLIAAACLLVPAAAAIYWFQPHKLFIDDTVDEAFPTVVAGQAPQPSETSAPGPTPTSSATPSAESVAAPSPSTLAPSTPAPLTIAPATLAPPTIAPATLAPPTTAAGPVELGRGTFRSLEHDTTGAVAAFDLADGSRVLRIEDLDASNGPDLRVILSSAPISDDFEIWGEDYVELGKLKGNKGSQNYTIPAEVDLARYGRVVIWCDRFDVGFGVADLAI